jgi:ParB-like chromosome segregation protein Spo0J
MKELTIIAELKNLLPPLTETEFTGLETSILKDGCLSPLVVWNNILVDGHHRYEICSKHQIPYAVKNVELTSLEEAKLWAWQHQDNRRNLIPFIRAEIALQFKDMIAAKAKERQRCGQGGILLLENSPKANDTRKELAKMADVSDNTIAKVEYIAEHADDETKSKLRRGEKGTSINKEYKRLKSEQESQESQNKSTKLLDRLSEQSGSASMEDFAAPMGLHCQPGEKPGTSGKYYVPKSSLKDLPHDQPEVLVAQLIAHFPRDYTRQLPFLIFDALRANDGNTVTKQLSGEIWHEFGKK